MTGEQVIHDNIIEELLFINFMESIQQSVTDLGILSLIHQLKDVCLTAIKIDDLADRVSYVAHHYDPLLANLKQTVTNDNPEFAVWQNTIAGLESVTKKFMQMPVDDAKFLGLIHQEEKIQGRQLYIR